MLSEKIYPNGINQTVSDDISPDVAYSCRESGEELKKLEGKLQTLARHCRHNMRNGVTPA